jgi:FkbM family methyltransferase
MKAGRPDPKAGHTEMFEKLIHYLNRYRYGQLRRMLPDLKGGYGASGQDLLIHQLLGRKENGTFVDIGANDGVTINNTVYLERKFGWKGIAVEPIPKVFEQLSKNRKCHLVQGCVAPERRTAKLLEVTGSNMLSTLEMYNTGLTARRIRKSAKRLGGDLKETAVECYRLDSLAEQFGIRQIDFLSLDTEGGELDILQSIDFEKLPVSVISVENNYFSDAIKTYLEESGFLYVGTFLIDEIYVYGGHELRNRIKYHAQAA